MTLICSEDIADETLPFFGTVFADDSLDSGGDITPPHPPSGRLAVRRVLAPGESPMLVGDSEIGAGAGFFFGNG